MSADPFQTQMFQLKIGQCETEEEFSEIYKSSSFRFGTWGDFIKDQFQQKPMPVKQLAKICQVDEKTARSFLREIPARRENVIKLGMILGMDLDGINHMLTHEARFQRLYAKNSQDAVWIYLIQNKKWDGICPIGSLYAKYWEKYENLYEEYLVECRKSDSWLDTKMAFQELMADSAFDEAMRKVIPGFDHGYEKLISFIDAHMTKRGFTVADFDFQGDKKTAQVYYRELKKLKKSRQVPTRVFLIALGLHMLLTVDEINEMLEYAGMLPLYSKDVLESRVIFYLENLDIRCPAFFSREFSEFREEEDDFEEDDLVEYIHRKLKEADVEPKDTKALEKMLRLL